MCLWALAALAMFGFLQTAWASPLDLYGLSPRSMGMGNAATAGARDYSALFYNPGRLGFVRPSFGVHIMASFDRVNIYLKDRPDGYDVPEEVYQALPLDPDATKMRVRYLPTDELPSARSDTNNDPNTVALTGGIVHNFGLHWLAAGLAFSIPLQALADVDVNFVDEREQFFTNKLHFQLLNRRTQRPSVIAGLAFRPLQWFGFGASVNVFGNVVAQTKMYVPDALDQKNIYFLMDTKVKYDAAVTVGMQFEPLDWLGIGISFRDRSWFGANIDNQLQFWNFELYEGEPITEQAFRYAYSFSPRQLSGGLRFDYEMWTLNLDGNWIRWSEYKAEVSDGNDSNFHDSYSVKAGLEVRPIPWLDVRAGGAWVPSPVGSQSGRTNYVDNNRVEASAGFSFYLPWVEGLSIDTYVQFLVLLSRSQNKDPEALNGLVDEFPDSRDIKTDQPIPESAGLQTNNPGFPGYRSAGFLGSAGAGVTYQFQ